MTERAKALAQSMSAVFPAVDFQEVWPELYPRLKEIAHQRLRSLRPGQTLSTTVLVHELYLKLADGQAVQFKDLDHLMALSSKVMRFILVDHIRQRHAQKRSADEVTLEEQLVFADQESNGEQLIRLDETLADLESIDARMVFVVECRVFGGLGNEEIARALNVSTRTVERQWAKAKMFLAKSRKETELTHP